VLSVRFFLPATLVALTTLVCLSSGFAQEGARAPAVGAVPKATAGPPNGTNVAVVDIAYIFKNNNRFNAEMKELQTEASTIEAWIQQRDRELQAMKEGLKDLKQGTPDFQKREEKLASEGTQFQLDVRRRQQEMVQKEAGLYYDAYVELEKTVTLFAQRNRIGIVLKYSRDTIKRDDRRSVMDGLARPVIYQSQLDISNLILTEINKGQPIAPAASTGPADRIGAGKTGLKKG
jgi:Skp family chaperone for outer membrane proteins